jgi:hypothetical protein
VQLGTIALLISALTVVCGPAYATTALCFNCGELHFGALTPCDKCGFQPDMENFALWTTFSDHFMTPDTLQNFGKVMKTIAAETSDFEERLWTFLQYFVDNYPENGVIDQKTFKVPEKYAGSVPVLLKKLDLKPFELQKSRP